MICPHCDTELKKLPEEKGRKNVYGCPKCNCKFCLVLITFDGKCYQKQYPEIIKELKRMKKDNKKNGKCGRPKKKFIEEPEGEAVDVSVDKPKLEEIVNEAIEVIPKRKSGRPRKNVST